MPVPGIDPLSTYASLSGAGTDSLVSLLQKPNSGVPAALVLSELMRRQRIGREGYNESDLANQTYESQMRNPNSYMASGGAVGLPYSFADPQVLQAYGQSAGDYPAPQRSSASASSRKGMRRGGQVKFGPGGPVGGGGIVDIPHGYTQDPQNANPLGLSPGDSQSLSDVALLNMLGGNFGSPGAPSWADVIPGLGSVESGLNTVGSLFQSQSGPGQTVPVPGKGAQSVPYTPTQAPPLPNSPAATQRGAAVPNPVNPRGPMPAGGVSALPAAPASGPPGTIGGAVPVAPGQGGITNSPDQGGIMGTDFNPNNFLINTGLALAASHNPRFTQALGESAQGAYQGEMQRRMAVYGIQKDVALKMQEFGKDLAVEQIKALAPGDQEKLVSRMEADPKFADSVHGYFNRQMFRQDPVMAFSSIMNQLQRDDPTMVPGSPEWAAAAQIVQQQIQQASQAQEDSSGGVPSVAPTARPYTDFTQ